MSSTCLSFHRDKHILFVHTSCCPYALVESCLSWWKRWFPLLWQGTVSLYQMILSTHPYSWDASWGGSIWVGYLSCRPGLSRQSCIGTSEGNYLMLPVLVQTGSLSQVSAVPSHEACKRRGQSHPWLVVCTVNQPSHSSNTDGGLGIDMYLIW